MTGLHWWQIRPQICLIMRQKRLVPIRHVGANTKTPKTSERSKPLSALGLTGFAPTFRLFRTFLKGQGLKRVKIQTRWHFSSRPGVGLKANLRRIKHLSNRRVGHAHIGDGRGSLTATAASVPICHRPTRTGTPFASCPTMAGRAARPGSCTPTCDHLTGSE